MEYVEELELRCPLTPTTTDRRDGAERLTREELDQKWSKQVADYLYAAGKSRADCVCLDDGVISFSEWTLRALAKLDAARAALNTGEQAKEEGA